MAALNRQEEAKVGHLEELKRRAGALTPDDTIKPAA